MDSQQRIAELEAELKAERTKLQKHNKAELKAMIQKCIEYAETEISNGPDLYQGSSWTQRDNVIRSLEEAIKDLYYA